MLITCTFLEALFLVCVGSMPEFPVYKLCLLVISPSHLLQTVLLIVASHCVGQSEDVHKLATGLDVVLDTVV